MPSPVAETNRLSALKHGGVVVLFGCLAVIWSFPLGLHLDTHLPGMVLGDNAVFLWSFWWMRVARAAGTTFFETPFLFAPDGVDLTLHTHAALPAFVGATFLGSVPLVSALNITTIGSLALNGLAAYWLAWRQTAQHVPSILAGLVFGGSPYLAAHLNGHFNLTTAWTIPLFVLAFLEASRGSLAWGVAAGAILGATAYIDYYYLVYACVGVLVLLALTRRHVSISTTPGAPFASRWSRLILLIIMAHAALIAGVAATGGFGGPDWPLRLTVRETFNPQQTLGILIVIWLWMRYRPRWSVTRGDAAGASLWPVAAAGATFVVAIAPLLARAVSLILAGQYVSQPYFWRSAPKGIDLATVVLGPPFHGLVGPLVRSFYNRAGIDVIEAGAWLGVLPLLLAAFAWRHVRSGPRVGLWGAMTCVFFIWALGSHAFVFGQNTAFLMPGALLRFIPIANNARMPGRAMVVVSLAVGVLAAIGIATYANRRRRPGLVTGCAAILVFLELLPAPFPLVAAECPAIYSSLVGRPEPGALVELPLAVGDGVSAITPSDHRRLVCQTMHQRPIVGGFVARLPPAALASLRNDPLLAAWLRMSGDKTGPPEAMPVPAARLAAEGLEANGIAFVMVHTLAASAELRQQVESIGLMPIAGDGERVLYPCQTVDAVIALAVRCPPCVH